MTPKYSYIIPFYNVRPYVRACLDSVLAQTFPAWECICVDDGSPDGLGEILDEYAAKDSRFKVIHQPNAGVGAARNAALAAMSGEWFFFVDGDDLTSPLTCEMCESVLKTHPDADMLMFGETSFPQDGVCDWGAGPAEMKLERRDVHDVVDLWMYRTGHCTRAYRRSVYGDLRNPNLIKGQDRYFLLDCLFRTNKVVKVDRPISGVRHRIGSTMRSAMTVKKLQAAITSAEHFIGLVDASDRQVDPALVRSLINRVMEVFVEALGQLQDKREQSDVFRSWMKMVGRMQKSRVITGFQQLRARVLLLLPFRLTATVLCLLPHKIKCMGFHR